VTTSASSLAVACRAREEAEESRRREAYAAFIIAAPTPGFPQAAADGQAS
jgi:hypothetical protein